MTLTLDRAADLLHIMQPGQLLAEWAAVGRLLVEVTPSDIDSQKRAALVFRQWPASRSLSPETTILGISEVMRLDVWDKILRGAVELLAH